MKERKDMDPRFMWKLTDLYEDEQALERAFAETGAMAEALDGAVERLGDDPESFRECFDRIYEASQAAEKLSIYAMLRMSADASDTASQELNDRATRLWVSLASRISLASARVTAMDDETFESLMKAEGAEKYRHAAEDMRRNREHMLSDEMEVFMVKLSDFAGTPDNAFGMFTDTDMTFPDTPAEDGSMVSLTNGNFNVFRESRQRSVRQAAFENYLGEYRRFINTFSVLYSSLVKYDNLTAETRRFASAMDMALFANDIPSSVYENLVDSVHRSLPAMKRYLSLRKRVMGLDEIDMYDLYVPMVGNVDMKVPFGDARALVKEALKPLGEEYQHLLDRAFDENWMDVYENRGKRSGAFSTAAYGVHPFVLLNYTDTLDDAYTVAHELGHSMHSFFSDRAQDYVYHNYAIFIAEVASTVNEVLLTLYLLEKETDGDRRAYILNKFAEGFRTTVYRQTLFAEFEKKAHEAAQNGEALTAKKLCGIYGDLLREYYDGAQVPELMSCEWSYIPHFYSSFYVYQYATGFSSAVAIARHIKETGDASGYLKFLSLGSSVYPVEALKTAGVDLTVPGTVDDALKLFDETVKELEKLI